MVKVGAGGEGGGQVRGRVRDRHLTAMSSMRQVQVVGAGLDSVHDHTSCHATPHCWAMQ